MQSNLTIETPLKVIHNAGAHLVLCRGKVPIHKGCFLKRPSVDECMTHNGELGLIPYSIGATALDLDSGDWRRLPRSWVNYPTRRKGGRHLYYSDDQARRNSSWAAEDCAGEVRGAKGYLCLWDDAVKRLADALSEPRQRGLFPFPVDVLTPAKVLQFPHKAVFVPGQSIELEKVLEGARGSSLFEAVRLWAYGEVSNHRDRTLAEWVQLVHSFTHSSNRRFPDPLPSASVSKAAVSVADWTWANYYDRSSPMQRKRGIMSGAARQKLTHDRDRAISSCKGSNASQAALYGLTVRQVQRIRARDRKALEAMKAYMGRYLKGGRSKSNMTAEVVRARTQAFLDDSYPTAVFDMEAFVRLVMGWQGIYDY